MHFFRSVWIGIVINSENTKSAYRYLIIEHRVRFNGNLTIPRFILGRLMFLKKFLFICDNQ